MHDEDTALDRLPSDTLPAELLALLGRQAGPGVSMTIHHATIICRDKAGGAPPADLPADQAVQLHFLRHAFLGFLELELVKALARQPLSGRALCRRVDVCESRVKILLAGLVDRGVLRTGRAGYELTDPVIMQVVRELEAEETA
jgi:hypothetical protein